MKKKKKPVKARPLLGGGFSSRLFLYTPSKQPINSKAPHRALARQRPLDLALVLQHLEELARREIDPARHGARVVELPAAARGVLLDPKRQLRGGE